MSVSAIDPQSGAHSASTRELRLIQTLISIRLRGVSDPEGRRHMNWVSDLVSAMSLLVERGSRAGAPDFGTYMDEALGFWSRLCESRGLNLSVKGVVPSLPDSLHLPLALVLHEIMGEVVRHYDPRAVGQAAAVAFAASATDISMVVSATTPASDDAVHAESLALVEGLVTRLGGRAAFSEPGRGGLTVKIHLPLATRQLQ